MIDNCTCLMFDLDGTLSNPRDGIVRSFNYALSKNGIPVQPEADLECCIGPPLRDSFAMLLGHDDDDKITAMVTSYRERYGDIGYKENILYDGIIDLLDQLVSKGFTLGICTSKPSFFAKPILEMFNIDHYFSFVSGGEDVPSKSVQIAQLLDNKIIELPTTVMVGDRKHDLIAAHDNGLRSVGVLWGYGSYDELSAYNPLVLCKTPADIVSCVM